MQEQRQQSHRHFQQKLVGILNQAPKAANFDEFGVQKHILSDGTEVRYFENNDAYHRTKRDDFETRINFLCDVANSVKKSDQIDVLRKKYLSLAKEKLNIEKGGKNFSKAAKKAKKLILELQVELIGNLYGEEASSNPKEATKKLNKAAQEYQISNPRPIIVHVLSNGLVDAQFPKTRITYPGDYPRGRGVIPNAVFDIKGHVDRTGRVDVDFVGSRAASYSTFDKSIQGEQTNIENTRQDIINTLQGLGITFREGQTVEINSTSLLTPLSERITKVAEKKPGHVSERLQLLQQKRALEGLNNQPLKIQNPDGTQVTVKPKFNLMNFDVKPKDSAEGLNILVDNDMINKINESGIEEYISQQTTSLGITRPETKDLPRLIQEEKSKPDKNIQKLYFYDVLQQYYSGSYKDSNTKGGPYFIAAQIIRSTEMAGVIPLWNCKTTKDRSGWASEYLMTLMQAELVGQPYISTDQKSERFKQQLQKNHEFGVSLEATGKNAPGARGNRVDDPTTTVSLFDKLSNKLFNKSPIDSTTSDFAKIKYKDKSILKALAKASAEDSLSQKMIDLELKNITNKSLKDMVQAFAKINNPHLRTAIIQWIADNESEAPDDVNFKQIVEDINQLFPEKGIKPAEFRKNYRLLMGLLEEISAFDVLNKPIVTDFIADYKRPQFVPIKSEEHIDQFEEALPFIEYLDKDRAQQMKLLVEELNRKNKAYEKEMKTEEKISSSTSNTSENLLEVSSNKSEPKEEVKFIYVKTYDGSIKPRVASQIKTSEYQNQHFISEYESKIKYKKPAASMPDRAFVKKAIELAVEKFDAKNIDDLNFSGSAEMIKLAKECAVEVFNKPDKTPESINNKPHLLENDEQTRSNIPVFG